MSAFDGRDKRDPPSESTPFVAASIEGFDYYLGADWKYISFGIEKRFDAGNVTIPIVVAPNPGGVDQYDVLYPQNIRDAITKCIENNTPLDPSTAEWLFNKYAPSFGLSMDIQRADSAPHCFRLS